MKKLIFLLFITLSCDASNETFKIFDRSGVVFISAPSDLIILHSEIFAPLLVDAKNKYSKIEFINGRWKITRLTEIEWNALNLTDSDKTNFIRSTINNSDKSITIVLNNPTGTSLHISGFSNSLAITSNNLLSIFYIHTDILGSVILETDIHGNIIKTTDYMPFGQVK